MGGFRRLFDRSDLLALQGGLPTGLGEGEGSTQGGAEGEDNPETRWTFWSSQRVRRVDLMGGGEEEEEDVVVGGGLREEAMER